MSRHARIAFAIVLSVGALWTVELSVPRLVGACSCAAPQPGEPAFTGDEAAVFIGTAANPLPDGTHEFVVERWFKGGQAARVKVQSDRIVFADGSTAIDTCGLHFEVGDRLIMAAGIRDGVLVPGLCSPHGPLNTDDGARLLNAAVAAFGQGAAPGQPPDPAEMPDDPSPVGFVIGMVAILVGVILIAVMASAWQRRQEPPS